MVMQSVAERNVSNCEIACAELLLSPLVTLPSDRSPPLALFSHPSVATLRHNSVEHSFGRTLGRTRGVSVMGTLCRKRGSAIGVSGGNEILQQQQQLSVISDHTPI